MMRITIASALILLAGAGSMAGADFHVAPTGNDAHPGTKEKPFATLERARDAARQAKQATVVLAGGTYRLTGTFALDERDSGTTYTGKGARITGSVAIPNSAVKPVTDKAIVERLLPEVRGQVLEEIDQPGEFMADKGTGKLYFLPPAGKDIASCRLEASVMTAPLIAIEGAANVVFDNIDIEGSRGMGVYIERGADNRIRNATLRNLGMVAVCVGKGVSADPDYRHGFTGTPVSRALGSWHEHIYDNPAFDREAGTGQGIVHCEIYNIGAGAISLGGGDRLKLIPAGNFVEKCDIHHFNRWDRTYKGAVNLDGVGNRVAHCKIHEGVALALYLHGNDHVIEFNEITRVMLDGDDMGALYMGRDPTERGCIIRYNYWHNLAPHYRTWCLYFDDSGGDGTTVHGNVFVKAGNLGTIVVAGASDFVIANNIFVDCRNPIKMAKFRNCHWGLFKQRMALVKYDQPPWSERYPEFAHLVAELDRAVVVDHPPAHSLVLAVEAQRERREAEPADAEGVARAALDHGPGRTAVHRRGAHQFAPAGVVRRGAGADVDLAAPHAVEGVEHQPERVVAVLVVHPAAETVGFESGLGAADHPHVLGDRPDMAG